MSTLQPFPNILLLLSLTEGWRTHRPLRSKSCVPISLLGFGTSGGVGPGAGSEGTEACRGSARRDLAWAARGRAPGSGSGPDLSPDEPRLLFHGEECSRGSENEDGDEDHQDHQ